MKVVLDSYDLLSRIGANRETFEGIDALVRRQASALLIAQLKHKGLDLERYRQVRSAIGAEAFELFMDTADEKVLKPIAKKIDPHSTLAKTGDAEELLPHLLHLAAGKVEPSPKPARHSQDAKAKRGAPRSATSETSGRHAITTKPPGRR